MSCRNILCSLIAPGLCKGTVFICMVVLVPPSTVEQLECLAYQSSTLATFGVLNLIFLHAGMHLLPTGNR